MRYCSRIRDLAIAASATDSDRIEVHAVGLCHESMETSVTKNERKP